VDRAAGKSLKTSPIWLQLKDKNTKSEIKNYNWSDNQEREFYPQTFEMCRQSYL
jgi:hypothetical protein